MARIGWQLLDTLPPPKRCDNCNSINIEFTTNDKIHNGEKIGDWPFIYFCNVCNAAVGCHVDTKLPLGRMADSETRSLRRKVHVVFDPIWKTGLVSRTMAYKWLASQLCILHGECHISWLSKEQLQLAIKVSEIFYEERKAYAKRRCEKRQTRKTKFNRHIKNKIDARKKH